MGSFFFKPFSKYLKKSSNSIYSQENCKEIEGNDQLSFPINNHVNKFEIFSPPPFLQFCFLLFVSSINSFIHLNTENLDQEFDWNVTWVHILKLKNLSNCFKLILQSNFQLDLIQQRSETWWLSINSQKSWTLNVFMIIASDKLFFFLYIVLTLIHCFISTQLLR